MNTRTLYLWISRAGGFLGTVCLIIALVTKVADITLLATPVNYVQLAIAAFLCAIWSVLYGLRDQGIKTG